jgi:hypothetical protein
VNVSLGPKDRTITPFEVLGLVGLGGLLVARFIPVARLIPFWGCGFRRLTGYPCPGCGLTRAADNFAHFHFFTAFISNPVGMIGAFCFAVAAVWTLLHFFFKVPTPRLFMDDLDWKWLRNVLAIVLVLNYAFVVAQHRLHVF